jgi:uncharacterized protein YndB with AHSA1/START domain
MSATTISKSIFLPAPPEVVWGYLTEQEKLGQWFHPSSADLVEGQEYELLQEQDGSSTKVCWGSVVSMNKPNSMEWTFTITPLAGAMTTVHWKLDAITGGTRLTLTHSGIDKAAGDSAMGLLLALDKGWDEHFMSMRNAI